MKTALITGITGQDGSYLAELLLEKGYEVHGIIRRASLINTHRIDHIFDRITLHHGDLTDALGIVSIIQKVEPTKIYNLSAQSHVRVSFDSQNIQQTPMHLAHHVSRSSPSPWYGEVVRIYQTHQWLYGLVQETPQTETTPCTHGHLMV